MTWIDTIEPEQAQGRLARLYTQVRSADGQIDNILRAHSLRPRTLEAHLALYRAVLHSRPRELSARESELVGVVVSRLNGCTYCDRHHFAGLVRHLEGDVMLATGYVTQAMDGSNHGPLSARAQSMCGYAQRLTRTPGAMTSADLAPLRAAGLQDAAILELNQVVSYFAYANRTVLGLGVEIADEVLGLHPDADADTAELYRHT
ncbi:MAG: peroxidase-related enzyme [Nannocystaceae bacterium]